MCEPVVLGFRAHSGWAAAVAVAGSVMNPIILERRRFETADHRIPGSKQPFHAAKELPGETAETFIRECRESSTRLAIRAVSDLKTEVTQNGFRVVGAAILLASPRSLPPLTAILRSHALIHTAEGEFFRDGLVVASQHCSLQMTRVKERDIWNTAGNIFGLPVPFLQRRVGQLGKWVGPPWRQDEKFAALAAWIALLGYV